MKAVKLLNVITCSVHDQKLSSAGKQRRSCNSGSGHGFAWYELSCKCESRNWQWMLFLLDVYTLHSWRDWGWSWFAIPSNKFQRKSKVARFTSGWGATWFLLFRLFRCLFAVWFVDDVCCILAFLADNAGGGSFQPYQKVLVFRGFAQARQSTPGCYHRLSYSELITLRYKCHQLELWLASKPAWLSIAGGRDFP